MTMLIKHVRDGFNRPYATIVALSPDLIGVAVCRENENFSKKFGIMVASGRAALGIPYNGTHYHQKLGKYVPNTPSRYIIANDALFYFMYSNGRINADVATLSEAVDFEVARMQERALKYFRPLVLSCD